MKMSLGDSSLVHAHSTNAGADLGAKFLAMQRARYGPTHDQVSMGTAAGMVITVVNMSLECLQ
jgi:hypothetical protein